jgi:hypothetical protein
VKNNQIGGLMLWALSYDIVDGKQELINSLKTNYLSLDFKPPESYSLGLRNYPNPFNGHTNFVFQLQHDSGVDLSIFDLKGNLIKKIINDFKQSGNHKINWNATNQYGQKISSGVYLFRLSIDGKSNTSKLIFLK